MLDQSLAKVTTILGVHDIVVARFAGGVKKVIGFHSLTAYSAVREEKPMFHPSQLEVLQLKRDRPKRSAY